MDLAEIMLPPVTFVLARRYHHGFKSGMRLFLSKPWIELKIASHLVPYVCVREG